MATYTCEIWKNKGFDTVNVPQKMTLLGTPAYTTQAMSLEQGMLLTEINVKINEDLASAATFVKLTNNEKSNISMVYNVQGYQMLAGDTAKLSIVPNFFCSLRETDKIRANVLTERQTVIDDYWQDGQDNGEFGNYTEEDELLFPVVPMILKKNSKVLFDDGTNKTDFVVSTLDLNSDWKSEKIEGTDNSFEREYLPYPTQITNFKGDIADSNFVEIGATVYKSKNTKVKKNIAKLRSYGLDNAIIASYSIPNEYWQSNVGASEELTVLAGAYNEADTDFKYYWSSIAKYKKIFTASNAAKFILVTAAGDKLECNLEDICPLSDYSVNKDTKIKVASFSDPQPDGAPFFAPRWQHGSDSSVKPFFPFSSVRGLQWRSVPIRYEEKSGTALTMANYTTARAIANTNYDIATEQQKLDKTMFWMGGSTGDLLNSASTGAYSASNISTPAGAGVYLAKKAPEIWGSVRNFFGGLQQMDINKKRLNETYALNSINDLQQVVFDTKYVAPQVNFPFSANYIRDYLGNGAYCYLLRISDTDVFRWNNILDRFGHKFTNTVEFDLTKLNIFNDLGYYYLKCRKVDFTSDLPIWFLEGLKIQLMAGIRVHKKLPE